MLVPSLTLSASSPALLVSLFCVFVRSVFSLLALLCLFLLSSSTPKAERKPGRRCADAHSGVRSPPHRSPPQLRPPTPRQEPETPHTLRCQADHCHANRWHHRWFCPLLSCGCLCYVHSFNMRETCPPPPVDITATLYRSRPSRTLVSPFIVGVSRSFHRLFHHSAPPCSHSEPLICQCHCATACVVRFIKKGRSGRPSATKPGPGGSACSY